MTDTVTIDRREHEFFKKPARMRQMPLRGAGIWHGLSRGIGIAQRCGKKFRLAPNGLIALEIGLGGRALLFWLCHALLFRFWRVPSMMAPDTLGQERPRN